MSIAAIELLIARIQLVEYIIKDTFLTLEKLKEMMPSEHND